VNENTFQFIEKEYIMGRTYIVDPKKDYHLLQKRLDANVTGAPDSVALQKILEILFTPEEANLAVKLPSGFASISVLANKFGIDEVKLEDKLSNMARRGLVIDLYLQNEKYYSLSPVVIGFFEYTFMRTRDDAPMKELAKLFEEYMYENDKFSRAVFTGSTQIGRAMVHEEAVPLENHSEILDWEKASDVIKNAKTIGVSLCSCGHKAQLLEKGCGRPLENCLSFNFGADMLIRNGLSRPITNAEGMKILEQSKDNGLVQTGDNVQRNLTYMCNCCGSCCGMLKSMNTMNLKNSIVSSNFIMSSNHTQCNGCGKCEKACPINAIALEFEDKNVNPKNKKKKWPKLQEDLCLGCGVCYNACKQGAISLIPRKKRVFTPETTFDRIVTMAIERGKLSQLILESTDELGYLAMGRILQVLEKTPVYKMALAIEPLKSIYLNTVLKEAKKMGGKVGEFFSA
jgi:ferredoxin